MKWEKLRRIWKDEDPRVTAPIISWRIILAILGIMYVLVTFQTLILEYFHDEIGAMVGVLTCYLIFVCLVLSGLLWLLWKLTTDNPLRRIKRAARRVAAGDFSVQIEPTRRDQKKNELDILIDDFNTMTRELASNEILKSDFIANVSHEIKTPLSVIQSYTKALKDGCYTSEEEREQYMDVLMESAGKLNEMITNILKLNKLENQRIFPVPTSYQLGEQLRRCALAFMDKWQAKGIAFEIDVADVAVCCDASLLELVWNNLLSNAIKFTERGGRISLTSEVVQDVVCVTILDSGCGMDEQTQRRIFEKFYQGDTSHASEGNGLGLALVKKIMDIVGGQISVESCPGKGTVFSVQLRV